MNTNSRYPQFETESPADYEYRLKTFTDEQLDELHDEIFDTSSGLFGVITASAIENGHEEGCPEILETIDMIHAFVDDARSIRRDRPDFD
jgi:hypothetical protein